MWGEGYYKEYLTTTPRVRVRCELMQSTHIQGAPRRLIRKKTTTKKQEILLRLADFIWQERPEDGPLFLGMR